jgi:hypothetical protein
MSLNLNNIEACKSLTAAHDVGVRDLICGTSSNKGGASFALYMRIKSPAVRVANGRLLQVAADAMPQLHRRISAQFNVCRNIAEGWIASAEAGKEVAIRRTDSSALTAASNGLHHWEAF